MGIGVVLVDQHPRVGHEGVRLSPGVINNKLPQVFGQFHVGQGSGSGFAAGGDKVTRLVFNGGKGNFVLYREAVLDIANRALGLLNLGGDALIALSANEAAGLGPLHALALANGRLKLGGNSRHVLGEDGGGAAPVRAVHKGDGAVGQGQVRVVGHDRRIVPFGDGAGGDTRVGGAAELEPLNPRQVVGKHNAASGHGQHDGAPSHLGNLFVFHGGVAGPEVDGFSGKLLNPSPTAHGLVVDLELRHFAIEGDKPVLVQRSGERGPSAGQGHVAAEGNGFAPSSGTVRGRTVSGGGGTTATGGYPSH